MDTNDMRMVAFPNEWVTGPPAMCEVFPVPAETEGVEMTLIGVLLGDLTGLWALVHPDGVRFARTLPDTDAGGFEVRDEGEPSEEYRAAFEKTWARFVELDEQAHAEVRARAAAAEAATTAADRMARGG